MDFKQDIFRVWAPPESIWSPWVKPVLFSQMAWDDAGEFSATPAALPQQIDPQTAIVVDLPGEESIITGVHLAARGFRPVPLFNACPGPKGLRSLVEVRPIVRGLIAAAAALRQMQLPDDAPPAFLLDFNRRRGLSPRPNDFDNRSISLPTDFPSATVLHAHGIRQILLIQPPDQDLQGDLAHTLRRWQEAGLPIDRAGSPPQRIEVRKPSLFRSAFYNLLATWGLWRNPFGGFGGTLPIPGTG